MKTASSLAQQSSAYEVVHLTCTDGAFIFNSFAAALYMPQKMDPSVPAKADAVYFMIEAWPTGEAPCSKTTVLLRNVVVFAAAQETLGKSTCISYSK